MFDKQKIMRMTTELENFIRVFPNVYVLPEVLSLNVLSLLKRLNVNVVAIVANDTNLHQKIIRMPSGEVRKIHINCRATIGQVGNLDHENITIGKAGRSRWLGIRPANRGVAMNPVDHPHGGGEGRSPVGRKHPVTKWGKCAMGAKTRKKKASDKLIVRRRK